MKADNCTGTVNVQGDASSRSKLIVQTLREHTIGIEENLVFSQDAAGFSFYNI